MKTDFYTKTILTIIASCLIYLVVRDVSLVDHAQAQTRGTIDVNIIKLGGKTINPFDLDNSNPALPVKVK